MTTSVITTETVTVDGQARVARWLVTGPLRFRAELPGCLRDECAAGQLAPCVKPGGHIKIVGAWLGHIRTHCHGWHREKVEAFAAAAAKTHGERRHPNRLPGVMVHMRRTTGRARALAPCPSWPVVEARQLTAPLCDCESCAATLALIGGKA